MAKTIFNLKNSILFCLPFSSVFVFKQEQILFQVQPLKIINKKNLFAHFRVTLNTIRQVKMQHKDIKFWN